MNRHIQILGVVLVAQLALSIFLATRGNDLEAFSTDALLLSFDPEGVDTIAISSSDDEKVVLSKSGSDWVLSEKDSFPASSVKVKDFTSKLKAIKKSWPVAQTKIGAKQLETSQDGYGVKVDFRVDDKSLETLYFGSTPTFKKVHARLGSEDLTYSVDFPRYEASTNNKDWFDQEYLQIPKDKIERIELNDIKLQKNKGEFTLDDLDKNEEIVKEKIDELVLKLSSLRFQDLIGTANIAEFASSDASFKIQVTDVDGNKLDVSFWGPRKEEKDFIVRRSDKPFFVTVTEQEEKALSAFNRMQLAKAKVVAEPVVETSTPDELAAAVPPVDPPQGQTPSAE